MLIYEIKILHLKENFYLKFVRVLHVSEMKINLSI